MTNYIYEGDTVELTAPYAVATGAGALVGHIFGVATGTVANAAIGEFKTKGAFTLAKDTSTFAQGDLVYWDNTAKACTSTSTSNKLIGCALAAAATGVATVNVRLNSAFIS